MDIKNRVMGDQPQDFLHKIAGKVPGYHGYVDKEKRRDADKILRTQLAHKYTAQHARLTRVQQQLLRSGDLQNIAEIDHLGGVLQRFINRLETATYGYAGLFDPIKIEAEDLDQLYAFDMALASGVDALSGAIDALESAVGAETAKAEIPAAAGRLSGVINDLHARLDQRADLLTSGNRLPASDYNSLLNSIQQPAGGYAASGATGAPSMPGINSAPVPPEVPSHGAASASGTGSTGAPTVNMSNMGAMSAAGTAGSMARVEGSMSSSGAANTGGAGDPKGQAGIAGSGASAEDAVMPTSGGPIASAADGQHRGALLPVDEPSISSGGESTERMGQMAQMQPGPDLSAMAEGNQGFGGTPAGAPQGGSSPMALGGSAGSGIESASSPSAAPGAPGGGIVQGMNLSNSVNNAAGTELTGTGSSDLTTLNPGNPSGSETQS